MTDGIRAPDIGMGASTVSAHKAVRDALLEMQRQAGRAGGVVLEGRDIGTVVFPDAEVKFFLTARPEVRARRRYDELVAKGANGTFEETLDGRTPTRRARYDARGRASSPGDGRDASTAPRSRSTTRWRGWPSAFGRGR